jgi:hypothetical protein
MEFIIFLVGFVAGATAFPLAFIGTFEWTKRRVIKGLRDD